MPLSTASIIEHRAPYPTEINPAFYTRDRRPECRKASSRALLHFGYTPPGGHVLPHQRDDHDGGLWLLQLCPATNLATNVHRHVDAG